MSDPSSPPAIVRSAGDVRVYTQEAKGFLKSAEAKQSERLTFFREAGLRFWRIKDGLPHGLFKRHVAGNFPETNYRQVVRYMKLAKCDAAASLLESWNYINGHGRKEPLGDSPFGKPSDGRTERPKSKARGGKSLFDWKKLNPHLSAVYRLPERIVKAYPDEAQGRRHERAVALLTELAELVKEWRQTIQGAK